MNKSSLFDCQAYKLLILNFTDAQLQQFIIFNQDHNNLLLEALVGLQLPIWILWTSNTE